MMEDFVMSLLSLFLLLPIHPLFVKVGIRQSRIRHSPSGVLGFKRKVMVLTEYTFLFTQ